jgi:hypothetical protein
MRPRRKHPVSVKLAIAGSLVLVLAACGALYFLVFRTPGQPAHPPAAGPTKPAATPPAPSPTLGQFGHIGSRAGDPEPLTVAQLFPARFRTGAVTFVRTDSSITRNCANAVIGSSLQSAVSSAGCSQAVRATYYSAKAQLMGTIGVLNLSTGQGAKAAARTAGANDFIALLAGSKGATSRLGQGTGIEEAAAKGHYLILIWAEFSTLRSPKTATQRNDLTQFMTELLQDTANVSLSNRMVSGKP